VLKRPKKEAPSRKGKKKFGVHNTIRDQRMGFANISDTINKFIIN
jgi:hypothetical protein